MRTIIRRAVRLTAALLLLVLGAAAAEILPLAQVKIGQKGKGRSVFSGTAIEEFDVEILGVLANTTAKRSIIIARLRGPALEGRGVISGMSGSPVYIDGKIVGAVAYGFAYSREAIGGITPIEEMLAVARLPEKAPSTSGSVLPFSARLSLEDLAAAMLPAAESASAPSWNGRSLTPLRVPLLMSGVPAGVLEKARRIFAPAGFLPVAAGGGQDLDPKTAVDLNVREGEALALQLVTGDLDVSAVGTATYVDGDKVLAFGHPLYNLGAVGYGMARARILTVVPTLDEPFKMGVAGAPLGSFIQDRTAGALGIIGRMPRFVPVNINLVVGSGTLREFKLNIIVDKLLTALLLNLSVQSVLGSEGRALGDAAYELEGDLFLDNGRSVHLEDLFSGNLGQPVSDLSNLVTAVAYYLSNNEFQEIGLHRIDLNIRPLEAARTARIERVQLDKYEVSPGEPIGARVFYRPYRGTTLVEEVTFSAPRLPAGTEFQLLAGDAAAMAAAEAGQYRTQGLQPRDLSQLIRLLGALRKNNRIYFKLTAPKPGLFLRGEEMPNLPPAMKAMFVSPRASSSVPTEITVSTLGEYQVEVPYAVSGAAAVPVRIRR